MSALRLADYDQIPLQLEAQVNPAGAGTQNFYDEAEVFLCGAVIFSFFAAGDHQVRVIMPPLSSLTEAYP